MRHGLCGLPGRATATVAILLAAVNAGSADDLRGHGGPVRTIAVGPAPLVLTGSFDTRAILWDTAAGSALRVLRHHAGGVNAVAFLSDGTLLTGGQDGTVALWDAAADGPRLVRTDHAGPVSGLAVRGDGGAYASSSWDGTVALVDLEAETARILAGHAGPVNGVAFTADGSLVTIGHDLTVRFWAEDGDPGRQVTLPAPPNALALGFDTTVWVAAADGHLYQVGPDGASRPSIETGAAPLVSLALSPDGRLLAAGDTMGVIVIVDTRAGSASSTFSTGPAPVWALGFDPQGTALLAGGPDNVVRAWEVATGEPLGSSPGNSPADDFGDSRGAEVFRACVACHTLGPEDGHRAGPTLYGLFGRRIATAAGFDYSPALRDMEIVWTPETVARLFEVGPTVYTPGTRMPEQRIPSAEDRAALIAFLEERTTD